LDNALLPLIVVSMKIGPDQSTLWLTSASTIRMDLEKLKITIG